MEKWQHTNDIQRTRDNPEIHLHLVRLLGLLRRWKKQKGDRILEKGIADVIKQAKKYAK